MKISIIILIRQRSRLRYGRSAINIFPPKEDKLERLRSLDAGVAKKGTAVSLIVGILGCLILGTGMSCVMVWGGKLFLIGVIVGIIGLAGVFAAYPLYVYITKKERERITPEILRLSDEVLNEKD